MLNIYQLSDNQAVAWASPASLLSDVSNFVTFLLFG